MGDPQSKPAKPAAPRGLGAAGRALWRDVLAGYELDAAEVRILEQAARTADLCEALRLAVDEVIVVGRPAPVLVELRLQRLTLARLLVAIRLPVPADEDDRTQRRGLRGVHPGWVS